MTTRFDALNFQWRIFQAYLMSIESNLVTGLVSLWCYKFNVVLVNELNIIIAYVLGLTVATISSEGTSFECAKSHFFADLNKKLLCRFKLT